MSLSHYCLFHVIEFLANTHEDIIELPSELEALRQFVSEETPYNRRLKIFLNLQFDILATDSILR